jgi:nicotinamide-nucleotide amidase
MNDSQPLEMTVGVRLRAPGLTVATAESCTGGLILKRLTDIAGSSAYVLGGVVSYANSVKEHVLGVDGDVLAREGAVSEPVARQMAEGVRALLGADVALSVTGIAGPGGGTAEKPVGLTYIGLSTAAGTWVRRFVWPGDRAENRRHSADAAFRLLLSYLDEQL